MEYKKENRICEHCDKDFVISAEEMNMYKKVDIGLPTICFHCRVKLHLSFWSFGKFRKGKSDLSGERLITTLSEDIRYPIYTLREWHSDDWDAMDYGQDYDPSRSFFEQLRELQEKIPRPHQNGKNNTKCEWSDDVWNSKNCYLSRSMEECEDLFYSYRNVKVKNSIDAYISFYSEYIYSSLNVVNCYKVLYSRNSKDCIDSSFLYDCRNCQNCFMSWNLRGKNYCIRNQQYDRDEYFKELEKIDFGSYKVIQELRKEFEDILKNKVIHRENNNLKIHNSTGDNLLDTKNCHNCFTLSESENTFNVLRGMRNKDCIDTNASWYLELCGNCSCCVNGYNLKYCLWSPSRNSEYLDLCQECDNCFGCVGLKKKQHCILNKQYSKEEYTKLKQQIIQKMKEDNEYGRFLPHNMSTGPFNFSTAFLYYPNTKKEDILRLGGYWEEIDEGHMEGVETSKLPDNIKDVSEDICTQALICPETGWRFNINKDELSFYKQNNIPLPRKHFDVRIKEAIKFSTVLQSYKYKCYYCKEEINAYYPHEWGYKNIACESCYKKNMY
jgi:hypothetical protein